MAGTQRFHDLNNLIMAIGCGGNDAVSVPEFLPSITDRISVNIAEFSLGPS